MKFGFTSHRSEIRTDTLNVKNGGCQQSGQRQCSGASGIAVSSTIPTQDEEPAKQKKADKKKSKKQTAPADDELPF